MLGAIIGDIIGSPYEFDFNNIKTKEFPLFGELSKFTDDTIMTLAIAIGLIKGYKSKESTAKQIIISMQKLGRKYPNAGYGTNFHKWLYQEFPQPYSSYGNGSAMRVSAVAWVYNNLRDVEEFAKITASVSHNHPEGIKGAQATAAAIFLARQGADKKYIKNYLEKKYEYKLNRNCDDIRTSYHHVESCQETVPEAITAFLEGGSFEEVIRLAVSLGGDSDTLTAIAGSIAEAYYQIPEDIQQKALSVLDGELKNQLKIFEDFLDEICSRRKKLFESALSCKTYFENRKEVQWEAVRVEDRGRYFSRRIHNEEIDCLMKFGQSEDFTDYDYIETLSEFGMEMDLKRYQKEAENCCLLLLRAMFTSIVRQERFNDGLMAKAIEIGSISAILDSMEKQLNKELF